jgi:glycosyltransferase involved in cell wall biosynthesis
LSLGKEMPVTRYALRVTRKLKYLYRFYKYIWQERKKYDAIFVHMNQEYILLGGLIWRLLNKKIMLWRNHPKGSFLTRMVAFLSSRVFCTSKYSSTAKFKKTEIMPVGIDTDSFKRKPEIKKIPNSILFLGRIAPIKKPDILIEALNLLNRDGIIFNALIVGDSLPKDQNYYEEIKERVKKYNLNEKIIFRSAIKNKETIDLYNKYKIFVNLTPNGAFDKTIFEAMACGCFVLASNDDLRGQISDDFIFKQGDVAELSEKLKRLLAKEEESSRELRVFAEGHSLKILGEKLFSKISN